MLNVVVSMVTLQPMSDEHTDYIFKAKSEAEPYAKVECSYFKVYDGPFRHQ
jgi:hypothetical protein